VEHFVGEFLTTPADRSVFRPPEGAPGTAAFTRLAKRHGVRLDAKTLLLYRGGDFFLNGERIAVTRAAAPAVRRLADTRHLPGPHTAAALPLLMEWYRCGALHPDTGTER